MLRNCEVNTNQTVAVFLQNDAFDHPENIVNHTHILLADGASERERQEQQAASTPECFVSTINYVVTHAPTAPTPPQNLKIK